MGDYRRNRNTIIYSLIAFCAFVIICIAFLPPYTGIIPILITLCLLFGYVSYHQIKFMKKRSKEADRRRNRLDAKKRRRRELLDKERGKVLEFPRRYQDNSDSSNNKL